jgi:hypothetical protein
MRTVKIAHQRNSGSGGGVSSGLGRCPGHAGSVRPSPAWRHGYSHSPPCPRACVSYAPFWLPHSSGSYKIACRNLPAAYSLVQRYARSGATVNTSATIHSNSAILDSLRQSRQARPPPQPLSSDFSFQLSTCSVSAFPRSPVVRRQLSVVGGPWFHLRFPNFSFSVWPSCL